MCLNSSLYTRLHARGSENVAGAFFLRVLPAPVRAATAYLQKSLTGLGCCSMENIPKPPVGVNTPRTFHTPPSLRWDGILSGGAVA